MFGTTRNNKKESYVWSNLKFNEKVGDLKTTKSETMHILKNVKFERNIH